MSNELDPIKVKFIVEKSGDGAAKVEADLTKIEGATKKVTAQAKEASAAVEKLGDATEEAAKAVQAAGGLTVAPGAAKAAEALAATITGVGDAQRSFNDSLKAMDLGQLERLKTELAQLLEQLHQAGQSTDALLPHYLAAKQESDARPIPRRADNPGPQIRTPEDIAKDLAEQERAAALIDAQRAQKEKEREARKLTPEQLAEKYGPKQAEAAATKAPAPTAAPVAEAAADAAKGSGLLDEAIGSAGQGIAQTTGRLELFRALLTATGAVIATTVVSALALGAAFVKLMMDGIGLNTELQKTEAQLASLQVAFRPGTLGDLNTAMRQSRTEMAEIDKIAGRVANASLKDLREAYVGITEEAAAANLSTQQQLQLLEAVAKATAMNPLSGGQMASEINKLLTGDVSGSQLAKTLQLSREQLLASRANDAQFGVLISRLGEFGSANSTAAGTMEALETRFSNSLQKMKEEASKSFFDSGIVQGAVDGATNLVDAITRSLTINPGPATTAYSQVGAAATNAGGAAVAASKVTIENEKVVAEWLAESIRLYNAKKDAIEGAARASDSLKKAENEAAIASLDLERAQALEAARTRPGGAKDTELAAINADFDRRRLALRENGAKDQAEAEVRARQDALDKAKYAYDNSVAPVDRAQANAAALRKQANAAGTGPGVAETDAQAQKAAAELDANTERISQLQGLVAMGNINFNRGGQEKDRETLARRNAAAVATAKEELDILTKERPELEKRNAASAAALALARQRAELAEAAQKAEQDAQKKKENWDKDDRGPALEAAKKTAEIELAAAQRAQRTVGTQFQAEKVNANESQRMEAARRELQELEKEIATKKAANEAELATVNNPSSDINFDDRRARRADAVAKQRGLEDEERSARRRLDPETASHSEQFAQEDDTVAKTRAQQNALRALADQNEDYERRMAQATKNGATDRAALVKEEMELDAQARDLKRQGAFADDAAQQKWVKGRRQVIELLLEEDRLRKRASDPKETDLPEKAARAQEELNTFLTRNASAIASIRAGIFTDGMVDEGTISRDQADQFAQSKAADAQRNPNLIRSPSPLTRDDIRHGTGDGMKDAASTLGDHIAKGLNASGQGRANVRATDPSAARKGSDFSTGMGGAQTSAIEDSERGFQAREKFQKDRIQEITPEEDTDEYRRDQRRNASGLYNPRRVDPNNPDALPGGFNPVPQDVTSAGKAAYRSGETGIGTAAAQTVAALGQGDEAMMEAVTAFGQIAVAANAKAERAQALAEQAKSWAANLRNV